MAEGSAVGLSIEVILIASLGVAAVSLIMTANYTGWDATTKLIFQSVLTLVVGVAFLLLVLKRAGYKVKI